MHVLRRKERSFTVRLSLLQTITCTSRFNYRMRDRCYALSQLAKTHETYSEIRQFVNFLCKKTHNFEQFLTIVKLPFLNQIDFIFFQMSLKFAENKNTTFHLSNVRLQQRLLNQLADESRTGRYDMIQILLYDVFCRTGR